MLSPSILEGLELYINNINLKVTVRALHSYQCMCPIFQLTFVPHVILSDQIDPDVIRYLRLTLLTLL